MERYQRVGVLGRGACATVVLVRLQQSAAAATEDAGSGGHTGADGEEAHPGGAALHAPARGAPLRVVKEIDLRSDERRRLEALKEAEVLKSLVHANIIAYHEALLVDTRLCIVMEYADGGDLSGAIARRRTAGRRFLEREAMAVFVQIALALQFVHERRILHRDLKSKNVFLTRAGVVKLGDFGIAKVFQTDDNSFTETQVGTPYYLPPEMCANQPYGFPADVWCLGVVFYELLALEVPFSAPTVHALATKICSTEPHPVPASYSVEARGLLGRMLAKRPDDRPTAAEIVDMPHVRRSTAALIAIAHSRAASAHGSRAPTRGGNGRTTPPRPCAGAGGQVAADATKAECGLGGSNDVGLGLGVSLEDFDLEALMAGRPVSAGDGDQDPMLVMDSSRSYEKLLVELEQELHI